MSLDYFGCDDRDYVGSDFDMKAATQKLLLGGLVGGVLGGVGGALLWPAHRIWGFVLSSMFIGAPIGYGVGMYLASRDLPTGSLPAGNRSGRRELPAQPQVQQASKPVDWTAMTNSLAAAATAVPKSEPKKEPMQPLNLMAMVGKRRRR